MTAPDTKARRHEGTAARGGFSDGWPTNLDAPESRRSVVTGTGWGLLVVAALFALLGGCAQNTESLQDQASDQQQVTPTKTAQDQAAVGTTIRLNWSQTPGGTDSTLGGNETVVLPGADGQDILVDAVTSTGSSGNDATVGKSKMGFLQINNLTINNGTTQTPSQTGSTTGSATAAQTPTGSQTTSPVQDIKPEISLSLNAAFAPGGMIDQLAAAVGKGSLSDLSKTAQQDLRSAYAKGLQSGNMTEFWQMATQMFGIGPAAATQPAAGG